MNKYLQSSGICQYKVTVSFINFFSVFFNIQTLNVFCRFASFGYIFSYSSMNEPGLGAEIDPGMAFNPFSSSIWIRQGSNPQP
jgi:hypothetical protein